MFAFENNGYNKREVDAYISNLKAELMQKKLSLLDSEQKVLDLKQKKDEIENKERNILKAVKTLERAQKMQEEGNKNLYALKTEQSEIIFEKIYELLDFLKERYPQISSDSDFIYKESEIDDMVQKSKHYTLEHKLNTDNDPMRALLSKMQEYRRQKEGVRTVRIERKDFIKNFSQNAENIDEFMSEKPQSNQLFKNIEIQSSGFDLKEAVNPKDDLDEIMKAFDFFNE